MGNTKKQYTALFKAKVAIAAIKQEMTQSQLTAKYSIHSSQINNWRKLASEYIEAGFSNKQKREKDKQGELIDELYRQIGQLKFEQAWLKKKSGFDK